MTGENKGIGEQADNMRSERIQHNRDILSSITKTDWQADLVWQAEFCITRIPGRLTALHFSQSWKFSSSFTHQG